jgi:eukaryotic-like serine/threonine-protein kinase
VLLVVAYVRDPKRDLEGIQQELDVGRKVTLIGGTGGPRWSRPSTNPRDMHASTADDGAFSVETFKVALLELFPRSPTGGFRFSAEVRHDRTAYSDGEVGIYFAHSQWHGAQGKPVHFFYGLCFTDLWNQRYTDPKSRRQGNVLNFTAQRCTETQPTPTRVRRAAFAQVFEPHAHCWRKVAVVVEPDQIQIFWEDQRVGSLTLAQLSKPGDATDFQPNFASPVALGLYVHKGIASFRRVVVEPLARGK